MIIQSLRTYTNLKHQVNLLLISRAGCISYNKKKKKTLFPADFYSLMWFKKLLCKLAHHTARTTVRVKKMAHVSTLFIVIRKINIIMNGFDTIWRLIEKFDLNNEQTVMMLVKCSKRKDRTSRCWYGGAMGWAEWLVCQNPVL